MASPQTPTMVYADRIRRYARVSTTLTLLSDERLHHDLEEAAILHTGIGGMTALLERDGTPIFVKIVPLTALEKRPSHMHSTRNVFQLPPYCHYGIGSPGAGVWRELAAHIMTTNWVLAKACPAFPILYHWRVLPRPHRDLPMAEEIRQVSQQAAFWGSEAVGDRLTALAQADDSVVLFIEYLPHTLHDWLTGQFALGDEAVRTALHWVESQLPPAVAFMNAHGLFHFDVHSQNVMTDGHGVYITDFGLTASSRFELSPPEREFLMRNQRHDHAYVVTDIVNEVLRGLTDCGAWDERIAFLRRVVDGAAPTPLMGPVSTLVQRYAPTALVMNQFYWDLARQSRQTPFPADRIESMARH